MSSISLYNFQEHAKSSVKNAWGRGVKSPLVSVPTGGGKTIIFSSLLKDVLENTSNRGVVLVHRDSLLRQAKEKLEYVWPGVGIGVVQADIGEFDKQITIASINTIVNRFNELKESCGRYGNITHIVSDECHHAVASTWGNIYSHFDSICPDYRHLGVTATPIRTNKKESLKDVFDEIVYSISIFQLISEGYLSPLIGTSVESGLDLKNVKMSGGDFNVKELSRKVNTKSFNSLVSAAWSEKAAKRKSVCFAVDIEHVEDLTKEFKRVGARAIGIHGGLPRDEQRRILSDFLDNRYDVLVNCQLLIEGWDEPSLECVMMARPTSSRGLYIQMLGRGLRLYPGKKDCLLIDFTANSENNKMITIQDVLDFYGLKNSEGICKNARIFNPRNFTLTPQSIPQLLTADAAGEDILTSPAYKKADVFDINKFAWTNIDHAFFVTVRAGISIAIIKQQDAYIPYLICSKKASKWVSRLSEQPVNFDFAMMIANIYLFDFGNRHLSEKQAEWREEKPSEGQISNIASTIDLYRKYKPDASIDIKDIPETKGDYSGVFTAAYAVAHIFGKTNVISKDAAFEALKNIYLEEEVKVAGPGNNASDNNTSPADVKLLLGGDYNNEDLAKLYDIYTVAVKVKYSEFPLQFLSKNPIEFTNNEIKIIHKGYPYYSLTEKQTKSLMLLSKLFRFYFKERYFDIIGKNGMSLWGENNQIENTKGGQNKCLQAAVT